MRHDKALFPLLLLLASWLAATLSGAAGFGGALVLLPVLSATIGVKAAVPVLTLAQLAGNASRVWFGRDEIRWRPVACFIAGAIPASLTGGAVFADLPARPILITLGVVLIGVVLLRRFGATRFNFGERGLFVGGILTGLISGVAGSAGPLGAAFFLGLNLPPGAYIASEAVTALGMHVAKTIVYQRFALVGPQELGYGLTMGIGMIAGSWTGKRLIERLPRSAFVTLVEVLLVISAVQLIVFS
jgi:hypothetical protein